MCFCLLPTRWSYMGQDPLLKKKLWHIKVTWLSESSSEVILLLPHTMLTLGHVATALCITSILICAGTCWLNIVSIKLTILVSLFHLSLWSGPQTLSPSDRSKIWEGIVIFGMWVPVLFFDKVLLAVTCSWACSSCTILLLSQTQLSFICLVYLQ